MLEPKPKFFIDRDEGDYYVIPLDKANQWESYRDGKRKNPPNGAEYVHNLSSVIFTEYEVES